MIDEKTINAIIHKTLKLHGFKKNGLRYNRSRKNFVDVVTIQKSSFSDVDGRSFTINIGILYLPFYRTLWDRDHNGFLTEADCMIRLRLGELIQEKLHCGATDTWWNAKNAVSEDELQNMISNLILPFFEKFENLNQIYDFMRRYSGPLSKSPLILIFTALTEFELGKFQEALDTLSSVGVSWETHIERIRKFYSQET